MRNAGLLRAPLRAAIAVLCLSPGCSSSPPSTAAPVVVDREALSVAGATASSRQASAGASAAASGVTNPLTSSANTLSVASTVTATASSAAPVVVAAAAQVQTGTALCYGAPGLQPLAPWPTVGLCPLHRGQSPVVGPQTAALVWTASLSGTIENGAAVAADGTIYLATNLRLYAIDASGHTKWSVLTPLTSGATPAIGTDGTVYIGTTAGIVNALNPTNAVARWSALTLGVISSGIAVATDGTLYVSAQSGQLTALNSNGTIKWLAQHSPMYASPAIGSDGTLYVSAADGLHALAPSGARSWDLSLGVAVAARTAPAIGTDGTIYVGAENGKLYAVNATGVLRWSVTTGAAIRSSPALASDGTIYFGSRDHKVYAVTPAGVVKWTRATGDNVDSTPAIGADGTVYIGSDDKKLYALKPADGSVLFSVTTGAAVRGSPVLGRNGTVYIGADDSKLYAVGPGICQTTDTTCNGVDDDCNGKIDDGFVAQVTHCGIGACASTGTSSCTHGVLADTCASKSPTSTTDTTCNGVDDNCNGQTDEGFIGANTTCGVSACAATGKTTCVAGAVNNSCKAGTPSASDTTCNGIDDNCNGQVDEGFAGGATSCGLGACANTGVATCTNGVPTSSCTPKSPTSSVDTTCNGIDDNCNGQVDEGFAGGTTSCGVGVCANTGSTLCVNGTITSSCLPKAPLSSSDTTCNGLDDNCNGQVDEAYVGTASTCGVGVCASTGTSACVGGLVVPNCTPNAPASSVDTTCNGVDENCSGQADEGYVGTATTCTAQGCRATGSLQCVNHVVVDSCPVSPVCVAEVNCNDGIDNDGDGLIDCRDSDCNASSGCSMEICNNGLDDNGDGRVDCADVECQGTPTCSAFAADPTSFAPALDPTRRQPFFETTSFLYAGPNAVQTGVAAGTISFEHAAVLKGRVLGVDGLPLPAAAVVTVPAHPEFGSTKTRQDGGFEMVVNGGGLLTVDFRALGYTHVQRSVQSPWQDYASLPDVILTALDTQATSITLPPSDMTIARGHAVTDADGTRQATLLFPQNVNAVARLPNGNTVALPKLTVRATEYTVGPNGPKAMPAMLPPTTGYTYAAELSVDEAEALGASGVEFSQPVPFYLENFLSLPTGSPVPVGFYDRQTARWVPIDDGHVVAVVSITAGSADIDWDGDGVADSAASLSSRGISAAERTKLATLYAPGAKLWRVAVSHFSPIDCNLMLQIPEDLELPPDIGKDNPSNRNPTDDTDHESTDHDCDKEGYSTVGCVNRSVSESIPIAGTGFSLHYNSARHRAAAAQDVSSHRIKVPVTGAAVDPLLLSTRVEVTVAGALHTQTLPAVPNQTYEFEWNGVDDMGRLVYGARVATIRICHSYIFQYAVGSGTLPRSYLKERARLDGTTVPGRTSAAVDLCSHGERVVQGAPVAGEMGEWTLSVARGYDSIAGVLISGDGTNRTVSPGLIETTPNGFVDGGSPATDAFGLADDGTMIMGRSRRKAVVGGNQYLPIEIVAHRPDGSFNTANTTLYGTNFALNESGFTDTNGLPGRVTIGKDGFIYAVVASVCCAPSQAGNCGTCQTLPAGVSASSKIVRIPYALTANSLSLGVPAIVYEAPFLGPFDVDANGTLYAVSKSVGTSPYNVVVVTPDGTSATLYAQTSSTLIASLAVADDGTIYLAEGGDERNFWNFATAPQRITKIDRRGVYSVVATHDQFCLDQPACSASTNCHNIVCAVDSFAFHPTTGNLVARVTMAAAEVNTNYAFTPSMVLEFPRDGGTPIRLAGDPASLWYLGDGVFAPPRYTDARWLASSNGQTTGTVGGHTLAFTADRSVVLRTVDSRRTVKKGLPAWMSHQTNTLIPSEDGSEVYVFSPAGQHLTTLDAATGTTRFSFGYNSQSYLTSVTDASGNVTTITRDADNQATAIVAPFGQTTALSVQDDRLVRATAPDGGQYTMTYKGSTPMLETLIDPRGTQHSFQYDAAFRLVTDSGPSGTITLAGTYIQGAGTVASTSPAGRVTRYAFASTDEGAQTVAVTQPDNTTRTSTSDFLGTTALTQPDGTRIRFDAAADPIWGTMAPLGGTTTTTTPAGLSRIATRTRTAISADPTNPLLFAQLQTTDTVNGRTYTSSFDQSTRVLTTTTPAGRIATQSFDTAHRLTHLVMPGRAPIDLTYDASGRLNTTVQQSGGAIRTVTNSYDATSGLLNQIVGPRASDVWNLTRDLVGRVTSLKNGSFAIGFGFSTMGDLLSVTPPARSDHRFTYDASGMLATYLAPPTAASGTFPTMSYAYDADRLLTTRSLPSGRAVQLGYRTDGKLGSLTVARGTTTYAYTASTGRLSSIVDPGGQTLSFTYDGALPTSTVWGGAAGSVQGTVAQTYDSAFRVAAISVNGAQIVNIVRDADGLITSAGALTLTRSPTTGDIIGTTLGQLATTEAVSPFGEASSYQARYGSTDLYNYQITQRDEAGRITEKVETVVGTPRTIDYQYDARGQLTDVFTAGALTSHFDYDDNGNRLQATRGATIELGSYDGQDRLKTYGANSYTFSNDGDLVTKADGSGSTQYSYDELGVLRSVALADGRQIDYEHDAKNRRVGKKMNGARQWSLLYAEDRRPIAQLDAAGNRTAAFIYGSRVNVPDYIVKGTQTYRVLVDQVGSVRLVVNIADGSVAQRIDYDEFGVVTVDSSPGFQPFGFAGGLYDADTGFVRFGARDYDAVTGRWTAKDPILFGAGQANLYVYAGGDPVNRIDPSGLYVNVYFWDPVGSGSSSFGHVSVDVNGTVYSFGPNGNTVSDADFNTMNQQFRGADILGLNLTPQQEEQLDSSLQDPGDYHKLTNNCGDPVESGLENLGVNLGINVTPHELEDSLRQSGVVSGEGRIDSWNPYQAPWVPWSHL